MNRGRLSTHDRLNGVFYTPDHVARMMARYFSMELPATIVDPACGQGDLLVAIAEEFGTSELHFVGIDKDPEALEVCEAALAMRHATSTLLEADYFVRDLSNIRGDDGNIYVTMNPPFKGYGLLSQEARHELLRAVPGLLGRFNAAHAFLKRTIVELHPKAIVALMPGAWPRSAYNDLRGLLRSRENSWHDLPDSTFDGATTTAGILVLRNLERRRQRSEYSRHVGHSGSVSVRQGVATGADKVFFRIASLQPGIGRTVPAARGRDIARVSGPGELPKIWIPPSGEFDMPTSTIAELGAEEIFRLGNRFCVRRLNHPLWSLHESMPLWFLGSPKLIIPEICTRMSLLPDFGGKVLPLHSTIAIRLSSMKEGKEIEGILFSRKSWQWLRRRCPRMVNGAIRLTVPNIRQLLNRHLAGQ